jgi:ribose transport system substrate-binding protein
MKKGLMFVFIFLLNIVVFSYFVTDSFQPQAEFTNIRKADKLTVAYVPPATEYNFYLELGKGLEKKLIENGHEYFMKAPQKDSDYLLYAEMIKQIVNEGKANVIVTHYHTQKAEDAVKPHLLRAIEQGIVVIDVNSDSKKYSYPLHAVIGVEQRKATRELANYAEKYTKNKNTSIAILDGEPGIISEERTIGFIDKMKELNIPIGARANGHWSTEGGFFEAKKILKENPNTKIIFAANDYMALGAEAALKYYGREDVHIFGYDGVSTTIEKIYEDSIKGTVLVNPFEMGKVTAEVILDINNSKFKGGYVGTEAIIITSENAKKISFSITTSIT